jgi:hypothetical protein
MNPWPLPVESTTSLLMRLWQLPDQLSRELSAFAAAVMLGILVLPVCLAA